MWHDAALILVCMSTIRLQDYYWGKEVLPIPFYWVELGISLVWWAYTLPK